jgi:preprotein translocase subunit SecE
MNIFDKLINFLKSAWLEAKKVNWPTQKEVVKYTLLVLAISAVLALFLGGVDFSFTRFLNWIILSK